MTRHALDHTEPITVARRLHVVAVCTCGWRSTVQQSTVHAATHRGRVEWGTVRDAELIDPKPVPEEER